MNEKQKLNNLVVSFKASRKDETFNEIHAIVIGSNFRKYEKIGESLRSDGHEALALYEDTLIRCIESYDGARDFENYFNLCVKSKRSNLYRNKKLRNSYEDYSVNDSDENAATFEIVDSFDLEEYALSTKKTDQLALIGFLVEGADATTKAIVEAFLHHPNPTATAIANEFGFHHSKVTRALNRLAAKFSTKQYGNYHDYLVAL
ncbi:hypothetical protein GJU41_11785 [Bacillus idriensis]|uniref:Uncharacterized protein n=1 Tax=Metabacillus idriensis TaxID=324768 RepID=A0A6I2MFS0_9BACI|nr:hypothetical protein [Metabacillus idriensis]MRX54653.1 hypothetical protein [Metabacillus idriensis]